MAASPEDVAAQAAEPIRPFRVLPGGATAIPDEYWAAGIMLGALGTLWLIRRNLGPEGRAMASGTAAIVFLAYYLIIQGILRVLVGNLAERGDTAFARAVAFYS